MSLPDPSDLRLAPLAPAHAAALVTWRYPAPYDVYDLADADPADLLDPDAGFHALLAGEELVGFRSYGADGRVPGWDYDGHHPGALDTGGGLRPDLTGRGLGRAAIAAGLAHGRALFAPTAFRVTVAAFNTRALRVLAGLGFERVDGFEAAYDGRPFEVLLRQEV
ncbi:GNAT family N-acetyltransferase [Nocardioides taihuensis]|uniref:GNAT family N-acetyltransferase n=1 Tax=Nocardioides taihuensis TaxID=1835606 RepID=A0ABW0BQH7_9ACTN